MDDPRDVLTAAFSALHSFGKNTDDLELRAHDVDVLSVVGRWPLNRVELSDYSPMIETRGLLQDTHAELRQVDRQSGLLGEIEELIAQLNQTIDSFGGLPEAGPPDESGGDLDASVVGKWPPD